MLECSFGPVKCLEIVVEGPRKSLNLILCKVNQLKVHWLSV